MKDGILSGLFSAIYQNGDQYYDVGPFCPIPVYPLLSTRWQHASSQFHFGLGLTYEMSVMSLGMSLCQSILKIDIKKILILFLLFFT